MVEHGDGAAPDAPQVVPPLDPQAEKQGIDEQEKGGDKIREPQEQRPAQGGSPVKLLIGATGSGVVRRRRRLSFGCL